MQVRCPRCGHEDSSVVDSRSDGEAIRRRRECESCQFRFTTFERLELSMPMVVKKDGRREDWDRNKMRAGLVCACKKTPVSVDQIDEAVEDIERKIYELNLKEMPARQIGEFVMEALRGLDKVAYVRFASVYREFKDVSQFVDTLESLEEKEKRVGKKV